MAANHVKAWREHRRITQVGLAELIGTNASMVSLLEAGRSGLTPKRLRLLSTALRAPVGAFLEYEPDEGRADILDAWGAISESGRPIAAEIMRGFRRP
jgi:transcriptional regulator with XRE-family HTH domain